MQAPQTHLVGGLAVKRTDQQRMCFGAYSTEGSEHILRLLGGFESLHHKQIPRFCPATWIHVACVGRAKIHTMVLAQNNAEHVPEHKLNLRHFALEGVEPNVPVDKLLVLTKRWLGGGRVPTRTGEQACKIDLSVEALPNTSV